MTLEDTRASYKALRLQGVAFATTWQDPQFFKGKRSRKQLLSEYRIESKRNPRLIDISLRCGGGGVPSNTTTSTANRNLPSLPFSSTPCLEQASSTTGAVMGAIEGSDISIDEKDTRKMVDNNNKNKETSSEDTDRYNTLITYSTIDKVEEEETSIAAYLPNLNLFGQP